MFPVLKPANIVIVGLFADKSLDVCSHCRAEYLAAAELSLSFLSLLTEVMTVIRVERFNLAGSRN